MVNNNIPMPWLWLEGSENENEKSADCGCTLYRSYEDSGDPAIDLCPVHEMAPEMFQHLQYIDDANGISDPDLAALVGR